MVLRASVSKCSSPDGFGGFAEADLVRHHHAVAGVVQRLDDRRPIARRKIAAVQQHHDAAVRLRRRDVHIGHPHLLAVIDERQQVDGVGIGKAFKADAVGFARRRFGGGGGDERQERSRARQTAARKFVALEAPDRARHARLVPGIHVLRHSSKADVDAGSSPAMTTNSVTCDRASIRCRRTAPQIASRRCG